MTDPLPRLLILSEFGSCLAESCLDLVRKMKVKKVIKEDAYGARKRPVALVSVDGRELLCDAVTGTLYDPETGWQLGGQARLKLNGDGP